MPHHTKDKGDLGVAKAFADLVSQGYIVLMPATEHAPFDLVIFREGRFGRVQVKYRALKAGTVFAEFHTGWTDRHGVHKKPLDKSTVDLFCIYCPDTDACYYVRPADHRKSVKLRVTPTLNGQKVGVLNAEDYRRVPKLPPTAFL
ncbi:group I intron-associated PD-(D/E)XK endonuclease [Nocardioides stalactiti]|uniref:group I intron-associated PD-(D/E)XK endonuclease n=1 Tax=Nocardioides stalactiti TaxID=2755356 RepID=UPI0016036B2B|nr:group I intron-associated PD-(D/E)XK endonuclease [Nocardioides stalactiti]